MRSNQSFSEKVFSAIVLVFLLKLVYILYSSSYSGMSIILSIAGSIIVFFILAGIATTFNGKGNSSYGNSDSTVLLRSSVFSKIEKKYRDLAKQYEDEKNYAKAAHIYLHLLKDRYAAAETLERGKLYNEAALIYIKYLNNKGKAAACYEHAKSYKQAIKLYTELEQTEKVGDLYVLLNEENEAKKCYLKVIDNYKDKSQYVKASLVYRNKLKDATEAQKMLLYGWRNNKDAYNCLNNYFENIKDYSKLNQEIATIYKNETTDQNKLSFLQVLKHEFKKHESLEELTKDLAYEIIADRIASDKSISSELIYFNVENPSISKDIIKFKFKKNKKDK